MMEKEQILKAGKIMKVLRLSQDPMMDTVAIKLNCGLTYQEEQAAKLWAVAFELAESDKPLFDLALELHERRL